MLKQWHCLSVHQMPPPFLYNCLGINTDRQVNVRFFFASSIVHFDGYCQQTAMSIQTHNGPLTRTSSSSSSSSHSFSPFFVVSLSLFWLRPVVKTKFAIQSTVKRFTEQRWLTDWLVVPTNFTPADCPFQKEDNFAMLMSDCNRTSGAADASRSCYCQKVLRLRLMLLLLSSSVALKNVTEMKEKKWKDCNIKHIFPSPVDVCQNCWKTYYTFCRFHSFFHTARHTAVNNCEHLAICEITFCTSFNFNCLTVKLNQKHHCANHVRNRCVEDLGFWSSLLFTPSGYFLSHLLLLLLPFATKFAADSILHGSSSSSSTSRVSLPHCVSVSSVCVSSSIIIFWQPLKAHHSWLRWWELSY